MIPLSLEQVAGVAGGRLLPAAGGAGAAAVARAAGEQPQRVEAIAVDSRQMAPRSLFVALAGRLVDGHSYLAQAAAGGAAAALVRTGTAAVAGLPLIEVDSPLAALQRLAAWYRRNHLKTVVAITGSNGKTVVKDALFTQLAGTFAVAASPGSFNSQLGVPLAVLAAAPGTPLAVFEAGISAPGEMAALAHILAPDHGILTNVGLAHIAAFTGRAQLARQKLSLFAGIPADGWLILPAGDPDVAEAAASLACRRIWYPGDAALPRLAARHPAGAADAGRDAQAAGPVAASRGGPDGRGAGGDGPEGGGVSGGGPAGRGGGGGGPEGGGMGGGRPDGSGADRGGSGGDLPAGGGPAAAGSGALCERLTIRFPSGAEHTVRVRTRSAEIIDDLMMAAGAAHLLGVTDEQIAGSLRDYAPPPTRLEVWRSPTGVTLVNDLVSADPISVRAALRTASDLAAPGRRKLFVFGGMRELGQRAAAEYAAVGTLAGEHRFDTLILVAPHDVAAAEGDKSSAEAVHGSGSGGAAAARRGLAGDSGGPAGSAMGCGSGRAADSSSAAGGDGSGTEAGGEMEPTRAAYLAAWPAGEAVLAGSVAAVRRELRQRLAPGDTLLLKGPRHSGIDAAALDLMDAMAPNRLIVDLSAVASNIAAFRRQCGPAARIMAMVKALAYGSDLVRLSSWLTGAGIDQLGVSTADEGAELRRAGIRLPILVTLPTVEEAEKLARFDLTPALYSFALVAPLAAAARALRPADQPLTVHLKLDTGMHRVGVAPGEAVPLARAAAAAGLRVTGVMTHLASADDPAADPDTHCQLARFDEARAALAAAGFGGLLAHAAATAAAARIAAARYDMVRLGLGLYGLYPSPAVAQAISLQLAVTLLSRIAEVRTLARGDRVGYNGTYRVESDRLRAGILPLGYHDGIPWSLSNRGAALVGGRPAPFLGRISMDSLVVDLSAAPTAATGDEALLFGTLHGDVLRPEAVADSAGTIPYELLARLGPRIQRVYVGF